MNPRTSNLTIVYTVLERIAGCLVSLLHNTVHRIGGTVARELVAEQDLVILQVGNEENAT